MDNKEHLEPFILGYCKCGCKTEIKIRINYGKRRLQRYAPGHNMIGKPRPEISKKMSGEKHWNWRGGRHKDKNGYWYIHQPNHPFATKLGYVMEHRLVWEKANNSILLPWGTVHHVNAVKTDNYIENLEAMSSRKHKQIEMYIRKLIEAPYVG